MKRFVIDQLRDWKNDPGRKPLIVRGARQVGKTWAVMDFGQKYFNGRVHLFDLEKHPEWHAIFEKNFDVRQIIADLELVLNRTIETGKDLVFFDEIQSCPRALMALRYFYEDMPGLHVIAAGSLLEFAFKEISFPVGRVQFIYMHPMNFSEFLLATGMDKMAQALQSGQFDFSDAVHRTLLETLRKYFFIGGMPECVKTYAESGRLKAVSGIQQNLIETYRADFAKYAPYADKRCLNAVLSNAAKFTGQQIKYTRLAEGFTPPTNKKAFELLSMARLIHKIPAVSGAGQPLGAAASERKFKALILDIGLMQHLCGSAWTMDMSAASLMDVYRGALAEQFVGQELLAAGLEPIYYWSRDAKSSTAEVDYMIEHKGRVIPIEVKSGAAGRLKSLHLLLQSYPQISRGIVLSERPYAEIREQKLVFYPLYTAGYIK